MIDVGDAVGDGNGGDYNRPSQSGQHRAGASPQAAAGDSGGVGGAGRRGR